MNNPSEILNCKFRKSIFTKHLTAYGPHLRCQLLIPEGEGRTKQQFKDECDINVIMKRYQNTGVLENVRDARNARFADVTSYDFQNAMDILADARTAFEELPASIRDRFNNDPAELLDFVHDKDNQEEAADLGLLTTEATAAAKAAKAAGGPGRSADASPSEPRPGDAAASGSPAAGGGKPAPGRGSPGESASKP